MLKNFAPMATVAVKDVEAAARFYEGALGLERLPSEERGVSSYRAGGADLLVYESQYAGTNEATTVTWAVGAACRDIVKTLAGRGVPFEHYDMPGLTLEGDVHVAGDVALAWFKDPDGNIHHLYGG